MRSIFVVLFCTFCMSVFGMEERFNNFETHGVRLTIVNSTDKCINVEDATNSLGLFSSFRKVDSFGIPEGGRCTLEIAFKKVMEESAGTIKMYQDDGNYVSLNIFKKPSLSIKRNSNKGLIYKLYSAKKGGGAEYYLVVAKDKLVLSLCKPKNSSAQSYSEVASSDSDSEN
ncbi:MAG: hypothetical protein E7015_04015 [Alphaproteobacteria bacterium]|nr:hypothetical protein [Alphaproteobacteria bacterium]